MYVFLDLMLIGLAVALHMYSLLAVVVVLFVAQSKRGRQEAAVLQEKFGQAYLDYRKQTWFSDFHREGLRATARAGMAPTLRKEREG